GILSEKAAVYGERFRSYRSFFRKARGESEPTKWGELVERCGARMRHHRCRWRRLRGLYLDEECTDRRYPGRSSDDAIRVRRASSMVAFSLSDVLGANPAWILPSTRRAVPALIHAGPVVVRTSLSLQGVRLAPYRVP